jgi:hypothetical protein
MPSLCSSMVSCEAARSRSSGLAALRPLLFLGLFLRGLTGIFSPTYGKIALMFAKPLIAITIAGALTFALPSQAYGADISVVAKKTAKPIPSPLPKWPPSGFKGKDGVFAKVPTRKELVGLLSAKRTLQSVVKNCEEFACGAVIAAAETGCAWWEVTSKVFRTEDVNPTPTQLGSLTTYAKGSAKKAQTTIFLVSSEPILPEVYLSQIRVICHRSSSDAPKPGHTYLANPAPSPTTSS